MVTAIALIMLHQADNCEMQVEVAQGAGKTNGRFDDVEFIEFRHSARVVSDQSIRLQKTGSFPLCDCATHPYPHFPGKLNEIYHFTNCIS